MPFKHVILGFLIYGPSKGYELKKMLDNSVRHFWPADQSQIYRTLVCLGDQGLVYMEVVHQEEHPDRKIYSITTDG
ncbi:MAG: PadR family transcriptional regulator [Anaerolineales bacterium]|jgi:PadR family transcriptional regulator AphA|nr:PadR family transcriptional regulator [Anaerolineales bacterium]